MRLPNIALSLLLVVAVPTTARGEDDDQAHGHRAEELEEIIEELQERIENDITWQIGDVFWRTDVLIDVISSRPWGEEMLRQHFGTPAGPPGW